MGEVKGQDHIVDPESNQCTFFSFHVIGSIIPEICRIVFDLAKTQQQFWKKKLTKKSFITEFLQNVIR